MKKYTCTLYKTEYRYTATHLNEKLFYGHAIISHKCLRRLCILSSHDAPNKLTQGARLPRPPAEGTLCPKFSGGRRGNKFSGRRGLAPGEAGRGGRVWKFDLESYYWSLVGGVSLLLPLFFFNFFVMESIKINVCVIIRKSSNKRKKS